MGAKISVNGSYGLDIRTLDFSQIYYAYSYTRSGSIFSANYSSGSADEFRGSGFKYNSYGEPVGGTVTSYAAVRYGVKVFSVDGISVSATSIVNAAKTYSTSDDLSLIAKALAGSDSFYGGSGADYIKLYGGNDILSGKGGNDKLYGGAGNDLLYGGAGHDYLTGGGGSDTFSFRSISDSTLSSAGRDTIYDFSSQDKIDLAGIDANQKVSGNQAFTYIGKAAFNGKAGELRFDKQASDTYIYGDVNGDKKADFAIHLDDAVDIYKAYFIL